MMDYKGMQYALHIGSDMVSKCESDLISSRSQNQRRTAITKTRPHLSPQLLFFSSLPIQNALSQFQLSHDKFSRIFCIHYQNDLIFHLFYATFFVNIINSTRYLYVLICVYIFFQQNVIIATSNISFSSYLIIKCKFFVFFFFHYIADSSNDRILSHSCVVVCAILLVLSFRFVLHEMLKHRAIVSVYKQATRTSFYAFLAIIIFY